MPEEGAPRAPLVVIPDCNVLVHGRALHQLPWQDWSRNAIEILIIGPVVKELDRLKNRPGRPGRLARDVSTDIRMLLTRPDFQDELRASAPRVTRRLWLGDKGAGEPLRDGLDLSHGDQQIINHALWWLDAKREVIFLTDDTFAAATAQEYGLPCRLLPEDWLRPPEMDEAQKEAARLKSEVARLKANEPELHCWFEDASGARIERIDAVLKRYEALAPDLVELQVARILAANPMVRPHQPDPSRPAAASAWTGDIAEIVDDNLGQHMAVLMDRAIAKYEKDFVAWTEAVRRQLLHLHDSWSRRREWPIAIFAGLNKGNRPATKALVEIEASGNLMIARPTGWKGAFKAMHEKQQLAELSIAMPPVPPRASTLASNLFDVAHSLLESEPPRRFDPLSHLNSGRDADAFYWREGKNEPSELMALECENWRHQRDVEHFRFRIAASDGDAIKGVVTGKLSAANLTKAVETRLPVRIAFEQGALEQIAEEMVGEFERLSPSWRRSHQIAEPIDGAT